MATPGDIAQTDTLGQLNNLLGLLQKATGSSSTQTTSSNVSSEGVNALVQQILGGTQGLAAVSSGQKNSGLYNSSTNQLLTNDLVSRTAGEVSKAQAGTTQKTVQNPAIGGKNTSLLGSALLLKSLSQTSVGKKATSTIADLINPPSAIAADSSVVTGSALSDALTTANGAGDPIGSFISSLGFDGGVEAGAASSAVAADAGLGGLFGVASEGEIAAEGAGLLESLAPFLALF
jgi:hypothetical protein